MPSPSANPELRRARPLLGTLVEIRAAAELPPAQLHAAIDGAFAAVEQVQALMSFHDPASELSALNREAQHAPVSVHAHTWTVLAAAQALSAASGGAFDPAVGAQLQRWGLLPGEAGASPAADWSDIELLPRRRVRFRRALCIDLGGIAKGYAVDLAVQSLRRAGVESGMVNAGGDLRVFGAARRTVCLRHPQAAGLSGQVLQLQEEALASSSNVHSRRPLQGGEVSALVDPRSGRPYLDAAGISVRAPDCMTADALTKALLFAAPGLREPLLQAARARAYLLLPARAAA